MVRTGIIGMGGMGHMHFGVHVENPDVEVVALADIEEERLQPGESTEEINVGGGSARIDPERHSLYTDPDELIADEEVELVDICLPTFLHAEYVIKALQAGKNVLCEKPMAMNSDECRRMVAAAEEAEGQLMIAQCIRFWPEYAYLKETVESGRLGRLLSADFWRGGPAPDWSWQEWLKDSNRSGGAILDLHVHDVDFVHYLLGRPLGVCSTGAVGFTGGYDMVNTLYRYEDTITVHIGAAMGIPPAAGFEMKFSAAFEKGVVTYSSTSSPGLTEFTDSGSVHPEVGETDGYHEEIAYFVKCIENNERAAACTPESAAFSIELTEAEIESIESGEMVRM
jgi:predicted dehydrogenase